MDETKTNVELEEENLVEQNEDVSSMNNDELKNAIDEQMRNLRRQSMLIGSQTACRVILEKLYAHHSKPGKKTYRDYERLFKEIKEFCETGISRKVNADGTTSPVEENIRDKSAE